MEKLKFRNKVIFSNRIFLTINEKEIHNEYINKKYNNKTFLIISGILLLLNVINTLLIFILKNKYSTFKLNISMYKEIIFTLSISGFCFFSVLILYLKDVKNCEVFYWIISMSISFIIHCYSILVTVWADFIVGSSTSAFSITFLSFLLFSYNIFLDNSYILSTIERIAIAILFRLYENTTPVSTFELITTLIYNITFSLIVYFAEKRDKILFFIISKFEDEVKKKLEFMEKLSIGLVIYSGERLIYINEFIKEKIRQNIEVECFNSNNSQTNSLNSLDLKLRNYLFKGIDILNEKILENLGKNIPNFENLMKVIDKIKDNQQNFSILGNKTLLNEDIFEISFRYNKEFNYVEFNVKDISLITKVQEYQNKIKYRTLFLSKVAHEFKNPLICMTELINQLSESLNIYRNNSKIEKKILDIKNISNYLFLLIRDFNYLSTSENDIEAEVILEKVDLKEMTEFCISIFKTRIDFSDKNIGLILEYDKNIPKFIVSDELRIKQMLINLLSNSFKFTKFGSIKLIVNHSLEDQKHYLNFTVEDSGIGIPLDKINLLTKPFTKFEKENNLFGSGLGLNIVSDFCKKLGKDLRISSIEGEGTSISFKILDNTEIDNDFINNFNKNNFSEIFKCEYSKVEEDLKKNETEIILETSKDTQKRNYFLDIKDIEIPIFSYLNKESVSLSSNKNKQSSKVSLDINEINLKTPKKFDFRIIICDDELLILSSLEKLFLKIMENENILIDMKIASDGAECIYYLYQGIKKGIKYDAIISDENMNFINGSLLFEIINKLRSKSLIYNIKLFLSSASESIYNNINSNNILQKPISQKKLEEFLISLRS